jgi:hypothetical protein
MSAGPILEVGRAGGGSTLVLLGASGSRPVVSIDRAPVHAAIADRVFARPEVSRRLKLYRQSSREPIGESEFGMMFVDGDHSYDGVCHDIATFWNALKSFDGKPSLAAFHDAADNPISYVESVRRACLELIAEPGAAHVVEDWGSMLVLEKTGNIDPERWYAKEDDRFWSSYADRQHSILRSNPARGQLGTREPPKLAAANLLGEENIEDPCWEKRGLVIERVTRFGADNPLRLLREIGETGEHRIAKTVALDCAGFCFSVFLRPHHIAGLRISVLDPRTGELAHAHFDLADQPRIGETFARSGVEIADARFSYRNGYFRCDLGLRVSEPIAAATFAINALSSTGPSTIYAGSRKRGFFMNLSNVREIL